MRLWTLAYRLVALAWAAFLTFGERDSSAYLRGSLGAGHVLPGLSDVDVAVVLSEDPRGAGIARLRARARWQRLRRAVPPTDLLLDFPLILEAGQLRDAAGSSALTHKRATYYGPGFSEDKVRMLERPGLYGATSDWRLLSGRERRFPEPPRDAQERRIAAWLELVYWWQWVVPACVDPGPRTASLCAKLVAEPARIWLWLAHGEECRDRADVLRRASARMPEEERGLRLALDLNESLAASPKAPVSQVLPLLVRLSARIADELVGQGADAGTTEVRLAGTELILPHGNERAPNPLPLCDWRALVRPGLPDESFALLRGDPGDPAALRAANAWHTFGLLPALRAGDLMVFAGPRSRTELRALECPLTDPVSFALVDGRELAAFPDLAGWSAEDSARRAVAEHGAWLRAAPAPIPGLRPTDSAGGVLAMLLSAARAALFQESVAGGGTPELPLTVTEVARRLAERSEGAAAAAEDALEGYRDFALLRTPPRRLTLDAMRAVVEGLPAYAQIRSATVRACLL